MVQTQDPNYGDDSRSRSEVLSNKSYYCTDADHLNDIIQSKQQYWLISHNIDQSPKYDQTWLEP